MHEAPLVTSWPPPYIVRKHRRARYVKIRPAKQHGLIITIPYRFSLKDIPNVLEEHKAWILKQLAKLASRAAATLPQQIIFPPLAQTWQVSYVACDAKLEIIQRPQQELVMVGDLQNKDACKEKLLRWIRAYAQNFLATQTEIVSNQTQLAYTKLSVRDQKTLWGSCTLHKTISLNYKLIFLPLHLVQHVIIHELSHTRHLNHSARFWQLVALHDPAWESNRRELRRGDKFIPLWV